MATTIYTAGVDIETNHHEGTGTLGGFARDQQGRPVLLSCSHVLFPRFTVIDQLKVYSPEYGSTCCSRGEPIATPMYDRNVAAVPDGAGGYVGGYRNGTWTGGFTWIPAKIASGVKSAMATASASETDCATARLGPGIRFHNAWQVTSGGTVETIPLAGAVSEGLGVRKGPPLGTAPQPEQYVRMYSANAGRVVSGTILSTPPPDFEHVDDPDHLIYRWGVNDPSDAAQGAKANVNQMIFLPRPTPRPGESLMDSYRRSESLAIEHGDSGSLVINHENLVVGMMIRMMPADRMPALDRSKLELGAIKSVGFVTPIAKVLEVLKVEIPASPTGWSGTAPASGYRDAVLVDLRPATPARDRGVSAVREGLHASVGGTLLLGKIGQHRREVQRLMKSVRSIAAAWRVMEGATFAHHCLLGLERPGYRIPDEVNGVTRQQLAATMLPLIASHASTELRRDIQRHGDWLGRALLSIDTMQDVPRAVAGRGRAT